MPNDLNPDFQDLIDCLTSQGVDFILVGAHALAFHGVARFTQDLDVWARRSEENAGKIQAAMAEFGIKLSDSAVKALTEERKMLRFGHPPRRIEILNFLDGCDFETASSRALRENIGGTSVAILGLDDYVLTKVASGRPKDASDLTLLRSAIGPLPGDES